MERTERAIFTNLCMVYDGQRVLVEDRVEDDWKGVTFPGGHVEPGEAFTDAARREIFEETGLTVSDLRLCGVRDWTQDDGARYIVFCYKTCKFSGELRSSDEGRCFWTTFDALPGMQLAEGVKVMLELFCGDASEQFYRKENGEWKVYVK